VQTSGEDNSNHVAEQICGPAAESTSLYEVQIMQSRSEHEARVEAPIYATRVVAGPCLAAPRQTLTASIFNSQE
jgi:hypothetical protein